MHARGRRGTGLRIGLGLMIMCLLAAGATSVATGAEGKKTFKATDLSPAATGTFTAAKSASGHLAESDPALLGRPDATPVNVMIKYDVDATASYAGGVAGLKPTSTRVTNKKLHDNKAAVQAYNAYASKKINQISGHATQMVAGLQIRRAYVTAYGGVAAQLPANEVGDLLRVPGVVAVQQDTLEHPLDDNTSFIGATGVWPALGGSSKAGQNTIFADIDTGVWPEQPMLSPVGLSAPDIGTVPACQFGDGSDTAHLGPTFTCNNKLIGAYAFTSTYMSVVGSDGQEFCNDTTGQCSARDSEGHGTHTTTTAAGDCVSSAILYGVQRGPVCGIAPGSHVIEYRVCLSQGCFGSDSVSAIQQAIVDGADVINFSISGGASPYTDPVELAFLDAVNAGITVNASAGNSGPGAGTSDHGGPWVNTVGASTGPREFRSTLHLTADGGATYEQDGITLTDGISTPTPVVMAATLPGEDALCQSTLAPGTATGKIVACQRGTNGRIDKGRRVLAGGAVGMILYNAVKQDQESDNHYLPAIHIDGPSGPFTTFVNGHTNVMATWAQGTPQPGQADMMASFSSRGPLGDWIKPDVTAPGVQVLAGTTPQPDQTTADNGPPGNLFMAIAGTSMSSPHAAGAALLVKAAHPTWTPEEIKSALMTSSVQSVVKEDGVTPADAFDMGAGRIQVDRAVSPTLVFDENYADFAAAEDPLARLDVNIPSIDATTMSGQITTSRTAINVTGKNQKMGVSVVSPPGAAIAVSSNAPKKGVPSKTVTSIQFNAKKPTTFWVTITGPDLADGQYFGQITLVGGGGANNVVIPVAFVKKQGDVTLDYDCSPATFASKTGSSHCSATVTNQVSTSPVSANLSVDAGKLTVKNAVVSTGTKVGMKAGALQWSGTLSATQPPSIVSVAPGTGPAGGYLPLSLFGIPPIAGVGDETITNFGVPTFYFGGEPYTSLGVVSDGYLVVGGGDSSDVNFAPQTFPSTSRPNNVLAPVWTDMNPAFGGAIRIGTLTDGSNTWIVVDYGAVRNFDNVTTHTYEVWIQVSGGAAGTGPVSEQVTYSYDTVGAGDPAVGANWGAENRAGTSGVNLASQPADGSEYVVTTSPPVAGGSATLEFDVSSKKAGTFPTFAQMTSDVTQGITQVDRTLTAT